MNEPFVLALDIGGTNTRAAIIDRSFNVQKVIIHPTITGDLQAFLTSVASIIREICPSMEGCIAISAGVPGRVRWDGYIDTLPNVGISSVPLASFLKKEFGVPAFVANDAEAAALAEAVAGPYRTAKSLYFITISTGVGGALTIDGKLRNSSYEIGHTLISYKGEIVEFEHLASGTGLKKLCAVNGLTVDSAKSFFDLVVKKDTKALVVYDEWIKLLSWFINMVQDKFSPEVFTLTGGVMKSASIFLDDLRNACPRSRLEKCHFEQEAGLIGAAVFGFQKAE